MNVDERLKFIVNLLDDKKSYDIVVYKIGEVSSLADYMIIASGNSDTHIKALSDYVTVELKKCGDYAASKDGYGFTRWVCLDYSDIIVNIMGEGERNYYSLESIWGAAPRVDIASLIER